MVTFNIQRYIKPWVRTRVCTQTMPYWDTSMENDENPIGCRHLCQFGIVHFGRPAARDEEDIPGITGSTF
jgi:hypothetical protein